MHFLDMIEKMHVVGAAQDDHLFAGRRSLKDFVHPIQGQADIVLGNQIQGGYLAAPTEAKLSRKNPRSRSGSSARCERNYSPDPRLVVDGSESGPASKAMPYDSDPCAIKSKSRFLIQQAIDQKARVWHAAGYHRLPA